MKLSNKTVAVCFMGCLFSAGALTANASVPMPSQVPMITTSRPTQHNQQPMPGSDVSVHRATYVDPQTGMPVVYEVERFKNASGQNVEKFTNTQTGHVSSRIIPG